MCFDDNDSGAGKGDISSENGALALTLSGNAV